MKNSFSRSTGLFLLVALSAAPAFAQESARLDAIARDAARRFDEGRFVDLQTRSTTPPPPAGAVVSLTLDDATTRALERNLDIAVERLNPQTFDFSVAALRAGYHPTLNSTVGVRSQTRFSTNQTQGGDVLTTDTMTGNTGLSQNIPWGGGSFAFAFNNSRIAESNLFATRNPALNTNFNATMVQPLLRGFRIDGTRAQLIVTQLNQEISEYALRGTIVTTLSSVRNAYWDLVYTIQAVEVAQRSLALASKLVADNQSRVEVGTMAPIDVVQAQSEEALRRQSLVQTEANRRTAELALKRLLVNGTEDPLWTATLNPTDRPSFSAEKLDVEGAVRRALDARTDLQQSRRQLQSNDVSLRSLRDQLLPALDLTASYGASGVGGPQFIRSAGLGGTIQSTIPGGFGDALTLLRDLRAPVWNFQVNLSYPIGTSTADANLARARLQQQQTVAEMKQLELQVATEVTNSALQAENSLTRYQAAQASRELQQKRLDAELSKFEVGMSTNFFVVQAQRDLADSQNSELRALLDYRKALVDFQRVQEAPAGGRTGGGITSVSGGGGGTGSGRTANAGQGGGF